MAGTASPTTERPEEGRGKFAHLVTMIQQMTPEQLRQHMVEAGIFTESGELTPHYQPKPPAKRKKTAG